MRECAQERTGQRLSVGMFVSRKALFHPSCPRRGLDEAIFGDPFQPEHSMTVSLPLGSQLHFPRTCGASCTWYAFGASKGRMWMAGIACGPEMQVGGCVQGGCAGSAASPLPAPEENQISVL